MKLFTTIIASAILATLSTTAQANSITVKSNVPVEVAVSSIVSTVEKAGNHVFNVLDFTQGSKDVGNDLRPTTLVIFGSPKIGADALLESQTIALGLPLKILAYEDADGAVWLVYDDPASMAEDHGISPSHPAIQNMQKALSHISAQGAG